MLKELKKIELLFQSSFKGYFADKKINRMNGIDYDISHQNILFSIQRTTLLIESKLSSTAC